MNQLLTGAKSAHDHQPLTTDEERQLAAELTGVAPEYLLKVRATDDGLVVIIHTGQKFIYDLAAIQAAIERLAAGAGRFAREVFLAQLDADAQALLTARDAEAEAGFGAAAAPAGKSKSRAAGRSKAKR